MPRVFQLSAVVGFLLAGVLLGLTTVGTSQELPKLPAVEAKTHKN
jgi:hypothetical protein